MEKTTLLKTYENLDTIFESVGTFYVVHTRDEVSYGNENDIDLNYCEEHNIPAFNIKRDGGCIVHCKDNVSWFDIRNNESADFRLLDNLFLNDFVSYLKEKGLNAIYEDNDILVDGFKVASGCSINLPPNWKKTYTGVQISIFQNQELIKNVCKKEMKKVPKGLIDFGITTEMVENYVLKWFNERGE